MKRISTLQAATELAVYDRLQAREAATVDGFVEHCELWLGKEHTMPLLLAMIQLDDRHWPFLRGTIAQFCPGMSKALDGIINHIEKHRAEFIECEAEEIIKRGNSHE